MLKSHEKFHSANGKRQILVVDDEFINRELLGNVLKNDYEVLYAENGEEALKIINNNQDTLSLILMDLMMPGISGMELLKQLKEDEALKLIPVIVLTSDQKAEVESLSAGASDFIPKPYPQSDVILARVRRSIELSEDRQIINSTERDPLTGLYNREYFYRYAEQFDQFHKDMEMDAIIIDVNHFHMINERFGTEYGDGVLRRIGERVREMVADTGGIVCRREADTFMVYCPHGKNYQSILENASIGLAEDDNVTSRVRLRMGVYADVDKEMNIERRFDRAQMASDTVRNSFTQNIGIYDSSLHDKELYAEQLIDDFDNAIQEGQFQVYYQPKFDIRPETPILASAEALVRWIHPKLGMISPGVFIPLFEENGLIQMLDTFVWWQVGKQIKTWKETYGISIPVSVNVSRIDMYDPRFIDTLEQIISECQLKEEELLLEITESAYTKDSEQIIEIAADLRKRGFRIEMDDFGTGYSSLNMISALPIDALKLDMQFIRSAFSQKKDTRMLEVIIDIADYLSVPVIAEGVETKEQVETLRSMGCDLVQGYYFSKPIPAKEYERFIQQRIEQEKNSGADSDHYDGSFQKIRDTLSGEYEAVYYVDIENDRFYQLNTTDEDVLIERSGNGFFEKCEAQIVSSVMEEDREEVHTALIKDNLIETLKENGSLLLRYRKMVDLNPHLFELKVTYTQTADDHHIVLGVRDTEKDLMKGEDEEIAITDVIRSLTRDFLSVYVVNMKTDQFTEYSSNENYIGLGIPQYGEDFFTQTAKNAETAIHPEDLSLVLENVTKKNLLETIRREKVFLLNYRLLLNQEPKYVQLKAVFLKENDEHYVVIGVSENDAQMKQQRDQAEALRMATQDALTGVKSKYAYVEAEKKINGEIANGESEEFAVAICDLNDLKHINDTLGHKAGDEYIKNGCRIICNIFKHSPVYRFGGDEFVAILKGNDYHDRSEILQRMRQNSRNCLESGGIVIACGMSDYLPGKDKDMSAVFERADRDMYVDKNTLKREDK